ncbi:ABC transporter permease [Trinickia caryophylli]|uniref:Putative ABC transport system permease protein n=1 Tax=Trinickia caryophylli TaxID=28094 RepID=A0A1X7G323_TRICW|nr:ABC transporter permease [Trinickia caryophylli]PMS13735.1 ABC transporter permease [Trinickia caryophylli]TRX14230.1 ABC transporter permease [Trinickia caryophylli]WQE14056.1 ABC transporter permease [Trinickia caryophylli]SMF63174.1 putative ABC transport system permease protein [Trinickia caryophylli]GLU33455.1 membrane protein [Trinickia caryophylli]
MKYFPLVWAMLWRKKTRTTLTLFSIVIAFLLFGMLQGINAAFQETIERSNVNRLIVANRISLTESLPYSYLSQLESIKGVAAVSHESWFGPYYQDPKNVIAAFPVEPEREFAAHPEIVVPKAQIDALAHTRTGAIIGVGLAQKYGWKIGDRIPLHSTIWVKAADGNSDWDFDVVGLYEEPSNRAREDGFFFNYKYFDEARSFAKGTVGWYVVQLKDPGESAQIAAEIDRMFANSPNETKTQTEKEFQQAFLKQIADINLIVTYILFAVFFALLFAVGSTAMQAVREQIPELAVLKTLGFTDTQVLVLVLCQALALCVVAALVGLGIADLLFPLLRNTLGVVTMPWSVVIEGVLMAAVLAATTGIVPAWRAKRLVIVEALRS